MAYKLENLVLLYEFRTWQVFLSLAVYKDGRVKWLSDKTIYGDEDARDRKLRLSDRSMKRLMNTLGDTDLIMSFNGIETPEEDWGQESKFTLYIDNGAYQLLKKGVDWQYCIGGQKRKQAYPVVHDFFALLRQVGRVLVREGVGAECCKPPRKIYSEPMEEDDNPIVKTFVVYDFRKEETMRWRQGHGGEYRLEHYFFHRYADSSYEFEFQEGWNAGSHYDGGTAHNNLPKRWFNLTWKNFVNKFAKQYPAKDYFLDADELLANNRLKRFLGF